MGEALRYAALAERLAVALVAHSLGSFAAQQYLLGDSGDDAQVDAYIADARCGFGLDVAGGQAMFAAARQVADPARVAQMSTDLPVYVVVGSMDPVNSGLVLVTELVRRYEEAGLDNVTLVVYPEARHEVFNETNREEVFAGLVAWLDEQVG